MQPDIEVCMNAHHQGPYCATRLEQQYPGSVEEEEYTEYKLNCIASSFNIIHVVVEPLPHGSSERVDHEKSVN